MLFIKGEKDSLCTGAIWAKMCRLILRILFNISKWQILTVLGMKSGNPRITMFFTSMKIYSIYEDC